MLIDVREKYPCCARGLEASQTLRPFHDDSRFGIVKNFLESQAVNCPGFDPIKIDVVDPHTARILINERESRARNLVHIGDAETVCQAFGKRGFASTQVAKQ